MNRARSRAHMQAGMDITQPVIGMKGVKSVKARQKRIVAVLYLQSMPATAEVWLGMLASPEICNSCMPLHVQGRTSDQDSHSRLHLLDQCSKTRQLCHGPGSWRRPVELCFRPD